MLKITVWWVISRKSSKDRKKGYRQKIRSGHSSFSYIINTEMPKKVGILNFDKMYTLVCQSLKGHYYVNFKLISKYEMLFSLPCVFFYLLMVWFWLVCFFFLLTTKTTITDVRLSEVHKWRQLKQNKLWIKTRKNLNVFIWCEMFPILGDGAGKCYAFLWIMFCLIFIWSFFKFLFIQTI